MLNGMVNTSKCYGGQARNELMWAHNSVLGNCETITRARCRGQGKDLVNVKATSESFL
jgi:hypothetical protein